MAVVGEWRKNRGICRKPSDEGGCRWANTHIAVDRAPDAVRGHRLATHDRIARRRTRRLGKCWGGKDQREESGEPDTCQQAHTFVQHSESPKATIRRQYTLLAANCTI